MLSIILFPLSIMQSKRSLTLSMMVAALDVLTVMDTTARVIPTAATTNT